MPEPQTLTPDTCTDQGQHCQPREPGDAGDDAQAGAAGPGSLRIRQTRGCSSWVIGVNTHAFACVVGGVLGGGVGRLLSIGAGNSKLQTMVPPLTPSPGARSVSGDARGGARGISAAGARLPR